MTGSVNGRDQTIRLFYVAMTRAYEELRLLAPFSPRNYLRRRDLLPNELEVPA
jgi:ATP-dependent exoDNAse (exonuclease V) beta subunit